MMNSECLCNWDDLDVGRWDLNHSEKFFERKHSTHEKFYTEMPIKRTLTTYQNNHHKQHVILDYCGEDDKENEKNEVNKAQVMLNGEIETRKIKKDKSPRNTNSENAPPPNLVVEPFNRPKPLSASRSSNRSRSKTVPPMLYKYAEIYEKKKQTMIQRILQEEKQKRVFHCRRAPNFNAIHEQNAKRTNSDKPKIIATTPITPQVLKNSREMEEKKKRVMNEYFKRNQPQKFIARSAHVLQEEPFKLKKTAHFVELQPFNLHVEKRLKERKEFDEQIKKSLEEKLKQEEEEKKRREEVLCRELRKMTVFKARANPFK